MRHLKSGRKLGRNGSHRAALYRNMVTALLVHGRIRTTEPKAKELRAYVDQVITLGKKAGPASVLEGLADEERAKVQAMRIHKIRQARKMVLDAGALAKVFGEYAERFKDRPGGYTRIYRVGYRKGDNAPMVILELVDSPAPLTEAGPQADESAEG